MAENVYRILAVEDEELLQRLLQTALKRRGHRVEVCGDGQEALEKLDQGRYDVVVTDFRMPRMTGLTLIQTLRARADRTPIVLMSSNTLEEMGASAKDLAGIEFLRKPFGLTELYAAVQRAVKSAPPPG